LGVRGIYLRISGLRNRQEDAEFDVLRETRISRILQQWTENTIQTDEQLLGFRKLHAAMPAKSSKEAASPETLLRYCLSHKSAPKINLLVDIYNLVSLETRLALGAHDVDGINGDVHLRLLKGDETYRPLGSGTNRRSTPGEYAYLDDENEVICRLEVKQVEKTKVQLDTTDCFYIVQGSSATRRQDLDEAVDKLVTLTSRFCGGSAQVLRIAGV
jgi:DNA/RNA-binding domain of Phe-tRNA-synthetase-like protein